jgi:glycosyltransferase involved in cell wall biosynthesis
MTEPQAGDTPRVSVVVPVMNEEGNVKSLLDEIVSALRGRASFEALFVDDLSSDGTLAALQALKQETPELRVIAHDVNCGQSAAIRSGILAARGDLIVTLDGDGQNNPADIPKLLAQYDRADRAENERMVAGQREKRKDTWSKRMASRVGNGVRGWMLKDKTRDTGCGLKLFEREAFLRLPYFDHMHRFLPALMMREGYGISHVDVSHRERQSGTSKYTNLQRLWVSLSDLFGVIWLRNRARRPNERREV